VWKQGHQALLAARAHRHRQQEVFLFRRHVPENIRYGKLTPPTRKSSRPQSGPISTNRRDAARRLETNVGNGALSCPASMQRISIAARLPDEPAPSSSWTRRHRRSTRQPNSRYALAESISGRTSLVIATGFRRSRTLTYRLHRRRGIKERGRTLELLAAGGPLPGSTRRIRFQESFDELAVAARGEAIGCHAAHFPTSFSPGAGRCGALGPAPPHGTPCPQPSRPTLPDLCPRAGHGSCAGCRLSQGDLRHANRFSRFRRGRRPRRRRTA